MGNDGRSQGCLDANMRKESTMFELIRVKKEMKAWRRQFVPLAPKVGDIAPDFELYDTNGKDSLRLSDFRGKKPVALIFGSYT